MIRNLYLFLQVIIIACIAGCTSFSDVQPPQSSSRKTIAVMPLDNQTNSVVGALYMREEMVALLKNKGYAPTSISQTDQQLANQFGISLGGQIAIEDIPIIATAFGVDAIMIGRLRNFETVLMSYNQISASFTMYSAGASQPIWEYDDSITVPFSPLRDEDISTQLIGGLLSNVLDRSVGRPLHGAVEEFYQRLQHTLPPGGNRPY